MGLATVAVADDPILARIDFEDRETATEDWSHVFEQAPGLPRRSLFFDVVVDETFSAAGGSSLRLDLEGGSISYRMLPEASIPIEADAEYHVSVRAATAGLEHAITRLEVRVVDGDRLRSKASPEFDAVAEATVAILHSRSVTRGTVGTWETLDVRVATDGPACTGLQDPRLFVALEVMQPGGEDPGSAGERVPTVVLADIDGTAWFDELEVRRSPRLRIEPTTPFGIGSAGGVVEADVVVDDPGAGIVRAEVLLTDLDGRVVDRTSLDLASGPRHLIQVRPEGPGWHQIALSTLDRAGRVRSLDHAVLTIPLSDARGGRDSPRFGVSVRDWTDEKLPELEAALAVLDPDVVEVSMWPESNDDRTRLESVGRIRGLLDRQRRSGRESMIAIDRLHADLAEAARVEPDAVAAALRNDPDGLLVSAIGDWMFRLGTAISRWRIDGGAIPAPPPTSLTRVLEDLVADPMLLVGRAFDRESEAWGDGESCLLGSSDLHWEAQSRFGTEGLRHGTVVLEAPPTGWVVRDRVDAAARRGLVAWLAGVDRTMLSWDPGTPPDPALLAWSGLARNLGAVRPIGELPVSTTARCLLGDAESGPVLVAWTDRTSEPERIVIPVGVEDVEIVELDGRRRVGTPTNGLLSLEVGSTPCFIHGADRLATVLAASASLEPTRLETGVGEHRVELVLRNPSPVPLEGTLEMTLPAGWNVEPSRPPVRAGPGETVRVPFVFSWSGPPILGRSNLDMDLVVRAPRSLVVPLEVPLEMASDLVRIEADWSVARQQDPENAPLIVGVEIENVGDRIVDLELSVTGRRTGRETRTIASLAPGSRETRRLRLRAGLRELGGSDVRIEVREIDGPGSAAVLLAIPASAAGWQVGPSTTAVVAP